MLVAILVLGIWLAFGFFLGKVSQQYMVTVQPFEISPAIANHVSISGKNAADIVVDTFNDAATHASQFHGTEYYRYDRAGSQPVALHQAIKIPVQTSYDIQLSGISLDSLIRLYNGRRYQQWIISGDVLSVSSWSYRQDTAQSGRYRKILGDALHPPMLPRPSLSGRLRA